MAASYVNAISQMTNPNKCLGSDISVDMAGAILVFRPYFANISDEIFIEDRFESNNEME